MTRQGERPSGNSLGNKSQKRWGSKNESQFYFSKTAKKRGGGGKHECTTTKPVPRLCVSRLQTPVRQHRGFIYTRLYTLNNSTPVRLVNQYLSLTIMYRPKCTWTVEQSRRVAKNSRSTRIRGCTHVLTRVPEVAQEKVYGKRGTERWCGTPANAGCSVKWAGHWNKQLAPSL